MCTLTIIPSSSNFVVTINRDESPERAAAPPGIKKLGQHRLWLAPEPVSGSSNLVYDVDNATLAVLLNGAFDAHVHKPPYRKSRGQVVLDSFDFDNLEQMSESYEFTGIEPFTLVQINRPSVTELRWDGKQVSFAEIRSNVPQMWSSAMLYRGIWQTERKGWFDKFLNEKPNPTAADMLWFHQNAGAYEPLNALVMNRMDVVKTVSITQVVLAKPVTTIVLKDLLNNKVYQERF